MEIQTKIKLIESVIDKNAKLEKILRKYADEKRLGDITFKDDAIVLDPFSGSGTTCLAAKTLNKKYIGIEMNEEHYNTSIIRLKIREPSVQ